MAQLMEREFLQGRTHSQEHRLELQFLSNTVCLLGGMPRSVALWRRALTFRCLQLFKLPLTARYHFLPTCKRIMGRVIQTFSSESRERLFISSVALSLMPEAISCTLVEIRSTSLSPQPCNNSISWSPVVSSGVCLLDQRSLWSRSPHRGG